MIQRSGIDAGQTGHDFLGDLGRLLEASATTVMQRIGSFTEHHVLATVLFFATLAVGAFYGLVTRLYRETRDDHEENLPYSTSWLYWHWVTQVAGWRRLMAWSGLGLTATILVAAVALNLKV